jgi:hypothetical protein
VGDFATQPDKDRRSDSDRATANGPQGTTTETTTKTAANGAGADAAARQMGEQSRWQRFTASLSGAVDTVKEKATEAITTVADGVGVAWTVGNAVSNPALVYELFTTGKVHVVLPVNQAIRFLKDIGYDLIALDAATDKSNLVVIEVDATKLADGKLSNITASLSAAKLAVAGFKTESFTSQRGELLGLYVHWNGKGTDGSVSLKQATFHDVTIVQGGQRISAARIVLDTPSFGHADGTTNRFLAMNFPAGRIEGLVYPGMPPMDITLEGTVLAAALAHVSPAAGKTTLPAAKVPLPEFSKIEVDIVGLGGGVQSGSATTAGVKFQRAAIRLVAADGKELASVLIVGFRGGAHVAAGTTAQASIDKLVLHGDPQLVDQMLANPAVAAYPEVMEAVELLESAGIRPSAEATVTLANVTAQMAGDVAQSAHADFAAELVVPQIGKLELAITKLGLGHTKTTSQLDFERLTARLTDPTAKTSNELARLELGGVQALTVGDKTTASNIPLQAHGDIPALLKVAKRLDYPPAALLGALDALRGLGIKGDVEGNLSVTKDSELSVLGDFHVGLDVAGVGKVAIEVDRFSADSAGSAAFDRFGAKLVTTAGKTAASFDVKGVGGVANASGADFTAKQIDATGGADNLAKLMKAIEDHSESLPKSIKAAFKTVRALQIKGSGKLSAHDVVLQEVDGKAHVGVADLHGNFAIKGVGTGEVVLRGFDADYKAKNAAFHFDAFEASLTDTSGKRAVRLVISPTKGKANTDSGNLHVGPAKVQIDGDSAAIGTLVSGIRANIKSLPVALAEALELVEQYAPTVAGTASITATGATVDRKGAVTAHGDVTARVTTALGNVTATLVGVRGDEHAVDFASLQVDVTPKGEKAAKVGSLVATKGHVALDGKTGTIGNLQVTGDATAIAKLLDDSQRALLPPTVAKILGLVDATTITASASDIAFDRTGDLAVKTAAGANVTAKVVHDSDSIFATLSGVRGEGAETQFDALDVVVKDKASEQDGPVAKLHVGRGKVRHDLTGASGATVSASGNMQRLLKLLDATVQGLLPPTIAEVLKTVDPSQLDGSALVFAGGAAGDVVTAQRLDVVADLQMTDAQGSRYTAPGARIAALGANVTLDGEHKPRTITATGLEVDATVSIFSAAKKLTDQGNAVIRTGAATIQMGPDGVASVAADNVRISGLVTSFGGPAPTTKDEKLAAHDQQAVKRRKYADLVKSAQIHAEVPMVAGRYGKTLAVSVADSTKILIDVAVSDHKLVGTTVKFQPEIDLPAMLTARGVNLEIHGNTSLLRADLDWFPDLNITEEAVGYSKLALNLGAIVNQYMSYARTQLASAKPPTAADRDDAIDAKNWVARKHADWEEDAADNQRGKTGAAAARQKAEDAAKEPRGASMLDVLSTGVNLDGTSGRADVDLEGVTGRLHGEVASGLVMQLTAASVGADVGGGQATATGLDTGKVDLDMQPGGDMKVAITDFRIAHASWVAKSAPKAR